MDKRLLQRINRLAGETLAGPPGRWLFTRRGETDIGFGKVNGSSFMCFFHGGRNMLTDLEMGLPGSGTITETVSAPFDSPEKAVSTASECLGKWRSFFRQSRDLGFWPDKSLVFSLKGDGFGMSLFLYHRVRGKGLEQRTERIPDPDKRKAAEEAFRNLWWAKARCDREGFYPQEFMLPFTDGRKDLETAFLCFLAGLLKTGGDLFHRLPGNWREALAEFDCIKASERFDMPAAEWRER
ncbi:MAG: hypothetical protein J6Y62_06060 [Clostridia bacterium]|nr:hypothetical protein [Clostridia bacterium]